MLKLAARRVLALALLADVAACSGAPAGPVIVNEPGRVVVVQQGMPGSEPDGGATDDAASDASETADASIPDAAPLTCTGPHTVGQPQMECRSVGACHLPSCGSGLAYACTASGSTVPVGYPEGNINCVYSAVDSMSGGQVHCCEPTCVRRLSYEGDCHPSAPKGYECPLSVTPHVGCVASPNLAPDAYCCP